MRCLAVVAEGVGDERALPVLITKSAAAFGHEVYATKVIRAGGWPRLRQPGQLERFCRLAGSHSGIHSVVVVVDMDDDCAKREYISVLPRLAAISNLICLPVRICFCVREFEAWLLEGFEQIRVKSPEVSWAGSPPPYPDLVRGAKEAFEKLLGSKYRESVDQEKFSRRLDPRSLYRSSRSFRKFVRVVCDVDYTKLSDGLAHQNP